MADQKAGDFGKLFAARSTPKNPDIQTLESLDVQTSKLSKSKDPAYQRTTIYLPKTLHRQLKIAAMEGEREISEVVQSLVEEWLESKRSDV
ncbi:MAG: CopG family transcriptional regulator [Cyanobacteria bacterium P01_D01_bin.73]